MSSADRARSPRVVVPCPFDTKVLETVRYECTCGMLQPLCRLYFCRHCLDIRCGYCVSHEVDTLYCPNCFQTMPSAEARLKKHRCGNCFDCPICSHTLSTRAAVVQIPSQEDPSKIIAKKLYYMACTFCRWTTRDIGLPDQNVASGGWPEPENSALPRFASLQDHYRTLAQKEKLEKETSRFIGRKLSYMHLGEKYSISTAAARKRAGLPPLGPFRTSVSSGPMSLNDDSAKDWSGPAESKSIDEIEKDPWTSIFEDELSNFPFEKRLEQQLLQIDHSSGMFPRHKQLMAKRSQRCRECEHNLCKPEYNPASIKFKIQLAAFYHVPEIKVQTCPDLEQLKPGCPFEFVLKIVNPTQHATNFEILPLEKAKVVIASKEQMILVESNEKSSDQEMSISSSLSRRPMVVQASIKNQISPNTIFFTPQIKSNNGQKMFLPARDDAAEFDDAAASAELRGITDDKDVVAWRRGNKIGVRLSAAPARNLKPDEDVVVAFGLTFMYTNTVPVLEQREVQKVDVTIPICLTFSR